MKCVILCLFITGVTFGNAQTNSDKQYVLAADVRLEEFDTIKSLEQQLIELDGAKLSSSHINHLLLAFFNSGVGNASELSDSIEHLYNVIVEFQDEKVRVEKIDEVFLNQRCDSGHQKFIVSSKRRKVELEIVFAQADNLAQLTTLHVTDSEKSVVKR